MDYQRRALAIAVAFLSACGADRTSADSPLPEIVRWAHKDTSLTELLTTEPAECLRETQDATARQRLVLGRTAFRSPYLLGGQAARRGFSCHSCHTNGQINAHFFVEGMSGAPGTADVTNFHFSKTLGDNVFNPKPIPSLATLSDPTNIQERQTREKFILRLIEQEFDGATPPDSLKTALVSYVQALDLQTCESDMQSGQKMLEHRLHIIDEHFALWVDLNQTDNAEFVTKSLRAELGRLHRRFPNSPKLQNRLIALSREIKSGKPMQILTAWNELKTSLKKNFRRSLFNGETVSLLMPPD